MSQLRILLLGSPAFYLDEKPITIQRRALRWLLAYLAYRNEMVGRGELIPLFWQDSNETIGRRRLRESLSKLRAELPDAGILLTVQDRVGIKTGQAFVDALEFDDLFWQNIRIANSLPREVPLPESVHQGMQRAITLWRSPRFMAGANLPESEAFDHWLTDTGNQLEYQRRILLERMADHAAASGDLETAIAWLRRILEEEPFAADLQERLLTWLNQLGRRGEALAHCNYLHQLYQKEDIGEFPPVINRLCLEIRQQSTLTELLENPLWPPPAILRTAFVGRKNELQQLKQFSRSGCVVSILGESGSGKTRLVYEHTRQELPAWRVMVAGAKPLTQNLPFQPLVDMLRLSIQQEEWKKISPTWLAPLVQMMPELSTHLGQTARLADTFLDDVLAVVFESLHQVLIDISAGRNLVIFLDDAHWSDRTTLEALAYLLDRGFLDKRALLVIASQPGENNPALVEFLERTRKAPRRFLALTLTELTAGEASELASNVLGHSVPQRAIQQLLHNVSGYPLHLIETLRMVMEFSPNLDLSETIQQLPVPGSVQMLIRRRLMHLSANAQKILQVAAIAGVQFSPALLEKAAELEADLVVRGLEEIERAHLVQPAQSRLPAVEYQFAYEKIREAVLLEISEARKRLLHHQVAVAMQALPLERQYTARLAFHFEAAGDWKQAFDYWVEAGKTARRLYSRSETSDAFRKAEGILQLLGNAVSDEEVYRLYAEWADFLDDTNDLETALQICFALQQLGNERQSTLLLGAALSGLSRVYRRHNDYDRSLDYANKAIPLLQRSEFLTEQVMAHNRRAIVLTLMGREADANRALDNSLVLAARSDDPRTQLGIDSTLLQIATIYIYKGLPDKTIQICDLWQQSPGVLFENPDKEMIQITRANALFMKGQCRESYSLCRDILRVAQQIKNKRLETYAKTIAARAAMSQGLLDESFEFISSALQVASQFSFSSLLEQVYCIQGDFYRMFSDYQSSIAAHRKGLAIAVRIYNKLDNMFRAGLALIRLGETGAGTELLDQSIAQAEGQFAYILLSARLLKAGELAKQGGFEQAHAMLQNVITETERLGLAGVNSNALLYFGRLALLREDFAQAKKHALAVLDFAKKSGFVWLEVPAWQLLYQSQFEKGISAAAFAMHIRELMEHVLCNTLNPEIRPMVEIYFTNALNNYRE